MARAQSGWKTSTKANCHVSNGNSIRQGICDVSRIINGQTGSEVHTNSYIALVIPRETNTQADDGGVMHLAINNVFRTIDEITSSGVHTNLLSRFTNPRDISTQADDYISNRAAALLDTNDAYRTANAKTDIESDSQSSATPQLYLHHLMSSFKEEKGLDVEEIGTEGKSSIAVIFRYIDWIDILLMSFGTVGAIGDGMSTNWLLVFASRLMNSLGYGSTKQNHGNFMGEVEKCSLYFVYLGLAVIVMAFMEGCCWSRTSERQVLWIRYKYLEAILRQEVGFFDSQEATTSEIINSISKDTSLIQEVLSEKVPIFVMHTSVLMSGLAFSVYFSWRLSLVALPLLILLIIPGMIYGKYLMYLSKKSYAEYGKANTIVEQVLSSIKTVYSFTAERTIVGKYSAILDTTVKLGIKQGIAKGLAVGSTGLSFAIWAFIAWYGSRLVMYKGESGGRIYAAGISFILSGLSLGMALPDIKYFTEASVAATRIFKRIDRIP
ncbi:hypothetical protein GIB67_023687 [Kingdonia uniflora]|uniref:ABC transmembrane type-1 domain-containing protein n=1 Tax=Kingdonia uniflora TaxID=39325 RepID=A0A7J7MGJ4_9MAGN|nr:hypothetical protein GIB67_023687 [Kingdonia uniflora]